MSFKPPRRGKDQPRTTGRLGHSQNWQLRTFGLEVLGYDPRMAQRLMRFAASELASQIRTGGTDLNWLPGDLQKLCALAELPAARLHEAAIWDCDGMSRNQVRDAVKAINLVEQAADGTQKETPTEQGPTKRDLTTFLKLCKRIGDGAASKASDYLENHRVDDATRDAIRSALATVVTTLRDITDRFTSEDTSCS